MSELECHNMKYLDTNLLLENVGGEKGEEQVRCFLVSLNYCTFYHVSSQCIPRILHLHKGNMTAALKMDKTCNWDGSWLRRVNKVERKLNKHQGGAGCMCVWSIKVWKFCG